MLVRYSAAQKAAAEAAGTFIFVFAGAAAVIVNQWTGGLLGPAGVAAVHGVALAAAVSAFRPVSGGHVNPAVSLACAAAGRMTGRSALVYILAQLVGAVAAALAAAAVFPDGVWQAAQLGAVHLHPNVTWLRGAVMEAILAFALVIGYLGTAVDPRGPRSVTGIAVGGVAFAAMMVGGPVTGGAVNPARAFAVALAGGAWSHHLVFWLGPAAGAVAAGWLYDKLLLRPLLEEEPEYPAGVDADVAAGVAGVARRAAPAGDAAEPVGVAGAGYFEEPEDFDLFRSPQAAATGPFRLEADADPWGEPAVLGKDEPAVLNEDEPSGLERSERTVLDEDEPAEPGEPSEPLRGERYREQVRALRRQLEQEQLEERRRRREEERQAQRRPPWRRWGRPRR